MHNHSLIRSNISSTTSHYLDSTITMAAKKKAKAKAKKTTKKASAKKRR
ncbi:MAG: hypothetical protein NBV63_02550 [Candidatus Pacebacteria bacterium]|nr:hypothetical protein [Candidatus Paceibacterota bacterium]